MPLSSACMEMNLVYILVTADSHVFLAAVSLLLMKTLNSFGTGTRIRLLGALKQLGGGQSWCIISAAILWMSFCQILEQVSVLWDSVTSPTKASTHLTGRLIKKRPHLVRHPDSRIILLLSNLTYSLKFPPLLPLVSKMSFRRFIGQ